MENQQNLKIIMTLEMVNNLANFLDKLEYKGIKEVQAVNQILSAMSRAEEVSSTLTNGGN